MVAIFYVLRFMRAAGILRLGFPKLQEVFELTRTLFVPRTGACGAGC